MQSWKEKNDFILFIYKLFSSNYKNLENEAKAKVVSKKRLKRICENLDDKVKQKRSGLKVIRKEKKQFVKILMMKPI